MGTDLHGQTFSEPGLAEQLEGKRIRAHTVAGPIEGLLIRFWQNCDGTLHSLELRLDDGRRVSVPAPTMGWFGEAFERPVVSAAPRTTAEGPGFVESPLW